jgi:Rho GDP-dissociation inhibitor
VVARLHRLLTLAVADENDESLQKWKASLGLGQGKDISDPNDPRKCIILSLGLEVEGRDDIVIDLRSPGALEALESKPFIIKEGAVFRMKAHFKVQHEILAGLKYLQKVTRMGVSDKLQEMMVSILFTPGRLLQVLITVTGILWSQHRREAVL